MMTEEQIKSRIEDILDDCQSYDGDCKVLNTSAAIELLYELIETIKNDSL